ncbi:hypothetical protein D3C73_901880 [compost metagenome]
MFGFVTLDVFVRHTSFTLSHAALLPFGQGRAVSPDQLAEIQQFLDQVLAGSIDVDARLNVRVAVRVDRQSQAPEDRRNVGNLDDRLEVVDAQFFGVGIEHVLEREVQQVVVLIHGGVGEDQTVGQTTQGDLVVGDTTFQFQNGGLRRRLEAQPDTGVPQWNLYDGTQAGSSSHTQHGTLTSQGSATSVELRTRCAHLVAFELQVLTPVRTFTFQSSSQRVTAQQSVLTQTQLLSPLTSRRITRGVDVRVVVYQGT